MSGCPYCGESISAEARICKHCQRTLLYSAILSSSLEEKTKHLFLKKWQALDKTKFKHSPLSSYSSAKMEIDQIPFTLAWDLSFYEAEKIVSNFKDFSIEKKLQGGLPSTYQDFSTPATSPYAGYFYAVAGIAIIAFAIFAAMRLKNFDFLHFQSDSTDESMNRSTNSDILNRDWSNEVQFANPSNHRQGNPLMGGADVRLEKDEVQQVLNATVFIRDQSKLGSGFLITSDGYILTNSHVSGSMETPRVILHDGRQYEARKVQEDSTLDVALLKIDERNLTFLKLGDANKLYPGQAVVAIGNPGGLSFTVTRGIISYVGRNLNGVPYIQTDAAINRGNSGGPMINSDLEVVGINTLTSLNEQGISFALPINFVCAQNGIASGYSTEPSQCTPFTSTTDPIMAASIEGQDAPSHRGGPAEPTRPRETPNSNTDNSRKQYYQSQADEFRDALMKSEVELKERETKITNEINESKASIEKDPYNGSLQERIDAKVASLTSELSEIQKKRAVVQLQYVNSLIALLGRQKLDSAYAAYVISIENQIEQLAKDKAGLERFLKQ